MPQVTHFTIKDDQVIDLNPARAQAPASDHAKDSTDYEDENDSTIGELKLPCLPTIRLYQPSASTIHPSLPPLQIYTNYKYKNTRKKRKKKTKTLKKKKLKK